MALRKRSLQTTILILPILFLSVNVLYPVNAQDFSPPTQNPTPNQSSFNGTYTSWTNQQNTTQESWNWTNMAWEFGPYPNFAILLQNGTEVTDANFVPLGQPFRVVINIQKSIFVGNVTLGRAGLQWNTDLKTQNGTVSGNANCHMTYVNQMDTKYWNESNAWHVESNIYNSSETTKNPVPGPQPPTQQTSFFNFDPVLSQVVETNASWQIEIIGSFNATSTPMGPYSVNLEITDSSDNWIDFGYLAWQGKQSPNRMVAVGKAGFIYGGFQDAWTFEKLDMENQPVVSVSKGAEWKMSFNVTSASFTNITVGFDLASNLKKYVNVTNWYQRTVTELGGWVYNDTSGTYDWNTTLPVTKTEQVYGPHLEERWINIQNGRQINVTRQYWDPGSTEPRLVDEQQWVQDKMFLIYNDATHSFTVRRGYSYWTYDQSLNRDREVQVLTPLNESDPSTQFYSLSLADCNWQEVAPNQNIVEFVGSFSNTTYSAQDEFWFQISVNSENGPIWTNWENTSPSDFQIAVDKPVALSTILNSQGHPVTGSMLQIDRGEAFTVQSKVYGASNLYEDLDGVGVVFRSGFGTWAANESSNSDIEIRLVKDLTTGQLSSVTYNRTSRNRFVYGEHMGWANVNVTDWHTEFNITSGTWDWVESPHLIWNETMLTDWHWENSRLNQTEYARDPNSPNIWIDVTRIWVNDLDPAFVVPSYATLNSASVASVNEVVVANMSVTFATNAPESNYQWNMVFQNMTYGRDQSQGWGEHVITEWTNQQVYFVNGTITHDQPWYVDEPSTPLYTTYNGNKYQLNQLPYITIGGVDLPIKVRTQYDQWQQREWTDYLLRDPYNPSLGMEPRYYELQNGTKIYVQEAYEAVMRILELNCTDAYIMVDDDKVTLPNATTFNTYMNRAGQDWSQHFWEPGIGDFVPFNYELINGTRIYRNAPFETANYNGTTSHWEITNPVYAESLTTLLVESVGSGVMLNQTLVLLREPGNWQPQPDGSGYYLVMTNGTRITIRDPWGVPDNQRIVTVNGLNYTIGWPNQYYTGTFEGETLYVRGGGWDGYVHNFYYTDLGVEDGTKYELPYPGAMATSWWDLEGLESEGRKLRTVKSMTMNGVEYPLNFDDVTKSYYIVLDDVRETVTYPMRDVDHYYSKINGQDNWDVVQDGWIIKYGSYSERSNQFSSAGSIIATTGYDPQSHTWSEFNRYGYDRENATLYLTLPDGTRVDLDSEMYLNVWKVQVGNQTFYTTDSCDRSESFTDNVTGQMMYMNYFTTLDNEKVYFNWNDNPASWLEELHIPIPGTNYTRLIPFNWQPQQVFDKVYVYNITIPEQTATPTHTGVYYEDGSEVAVGTEFKVLGTPYGPGIRYNHALNNPNSAYIPWTKAPWNIDLNAAYMTTLSGARIYSLQGFGWNGNGWNTEQQWQFKDDDLIGGNKTVSVVEGGFCIYLNDTIKVDVTTAQPYGGMPNQYLILTNGTYLNVQWLEWPIGQYATMIGTERYLFRGVMTYFNFTDSGVAYSIADPFQFDYREILTPSVYQTPTISSDSMTWLWMNATSGSIRHDETGYYLVNASDQSRLDLTLVDTWWNLSTTVRRQIFQGQLGDYYPRFSATINGTEYFVLDPSPVTSNWYGEGTIEQAMYRYPSSLNVELDGTQYNIPLFQEGGYWRNDIRVRRLETVTINGESYEVQQQNQWNPSYQVTIDGEDLAVQSETMNIYMRHTTWGEVYTWMLTDLSISTSRQIGDIIVGTPKNGMWGIRAFTVVDETGAIDLDGDLETKTDQYFVRRIHAGSNTRTETVDRMWVDILWNPNSTRFGDEVHEGAWMGKLHTAWTTEWSESYVWYHASDMTVTNATEMEQIKNTVIDNVTGQAKPGYWDIAHMVKNQTWADVLAEAKKNNWNWIESNTNEWDWLWFGTQQDYQANLAQGNQTQNVGVGLRYEFAGLTLFNDTTQTHYFMPNSVGTVTFITPGEKFGNLNSTGSMILPLNATVDFGVSYNDVNGTLFPYSDQRSMWGWWDRPVFGADFEAPNFMNKPTASAVDQLEFIVHFAVNKTSAASKYNEASTKVDQHVGNWQLDPDVIDGRMLNSSGIMVPLRGNDVLANRSMAINYYVTASTSMPWDVKDEKGSSVDNNNVTESSRFDLSSQQATLNFASIKIGSTYDWSKPTTATDTIRTFNVTSKTSPVNNFAASYQSDAGKSSTGFDISRSMYFLSTGFPHWDGYAITNDPEVALLVSKGTDQGQPQPPSPPSPSPSPSPQPNTDTKTASNGTAPSTEPATVPPTQPPTEPPTVPPTNPPTDQHNGAGADVPWAVIGIGVAAALAVVSFVVVRVRKKK